VQKSLSLKHLISIISVFWWTKPPGVYLHNTWLALKNAAATNRRVCAQSNQRSSEIDANHHTRCEGTSREQPLFRVVFKIMNLSWSSGPPSSRKMKSYWRESSTGLQGWWGDWSISPTRRGWGSWACSAWRRESCEGTLEMPANICRVGVRRMGPSSFQWCPATGQGAMGTNWSRGSSSW